VSYGFRNPQNLEDPFYFYASDSEAPQALRIGGKEGRWAPQAPTGPPSLAPTVAQIGLAGAPEPP